MFFQRYFKCYRCEDFNRVCYHFCDKIFYSWLKTNGIRWRMNKNLLIILNVWVEISLLKIKVLRRRTSPGSVKCVYYKYIFSTMSKLTITTTYIILKLKLCTTFCIKLFYLTTAFNKFTEESFKKLDCKR